MRKVSALIVVLLVVAVASAGGYFSWQALEQYENTQARALNGLNQSLRSHNLSMQCSTENQWLGFVRHEKCNLERLSRPLVLLEIWQDVIISPLGIRAKFGVSPSTGFVFEFFALEPLLQAQEGSWFLPIGKNELQFTYRTGGMDSQPMPSTELIVTPVQFKGTLSLTPPYTSQLIIKMSEFKFEQLSQKIHLKNLNIQTNSLQKQHSRFFERSELNISLFDLASAGSNLSMRHFSAKQANILDGNKLASLNELDFESLRINSGDVDLRLDSNELDFYLDNIDWQSIKRINDKAQLNKIPSLEDYESLLTQGLFLNLDKLESNFIYQDRASALLGMSGDVKLNGELRLLSTGKNTFLNNLEQRIKAKLSVDLSNSLMLGPYAGLMMDFIEQGWLYQQGDRLVGNIYYANGKMLANGNLVSTLALLPDAYDEDH